MTYIQILTTIEIENKINTYSQKENITIINIITKNIKSKTFVDYTIEKQIPKYKAVEYDFVYSIIDRELKKNNIIIVGLFGMDKINIYNLILELNKFICEQKQIILVYSSHNIIKEGLINIKQITNKEEFDILLSSHEDKSTILFQMK